MAACCCRPDTSPSIPAFQRYFKSGQSNQMDRPKRDTMEPAREAPTQDELRQFASRLPDDQARALLARARPAPRRPDAGPGCPEPIPPVYASWKQFLERTTLNERLRWCRAKASKANSARLMSGSPDITITAEDVWLVLEAARGRCAHCGSLAVEHRPSTRKGAPLPWEHVGRRIGSLGHKLARFNGGSNNPQNLCWSCLWCNTWITERRAGAQDHGGYYPED
jgi:hypothetical protein